MQIFPPPKINCFAGGPPFVLKLKLLEVKFA